MSTVRNDSHKCTNAVMSFQPISEMGKLNFRGRMLLSVCLEEDKTNKHLLD